MYIARQPYKCIKCRHEFQWGPHDAHPAPVDSHGNPVCPRCWDTFLAFVGVGFQTTNWTGVSDYDKECANQK